MADLAIPPHSRRLSRLAVLGLGLLASAAFAAGLGRQLQPPGPSPFPRTTLAASQAQLAGDPPEATPAPSLQVADVAPLAHHVPARADASDGTAPLLDVPAAPSSPAATATAGASATDAAANAADRAAPAAPEPTPAPPDAALPPT